MDTTFIILLIIAIVLFVIPAIICAICLGVLIIKEAILYIKNKNLWYNKTTSLSSSL